MIEKLPKFIYMKYRLLMLSAAVALCASTALADPVDWNHPTKDLHPSECDCVVGAEGVTYHNMNYPSNPPIYYGGWVTFTSENEGDPVSITFTDFNCTRGGSAIVFVYDGDEILNANFTSYSQKAPEGYMVAVMPENVGTEYTATSGKLCVLYGPGSGSGSIAGTYTASVTAGTPHDMAFDSATATNAAAAAWRGARDVVLMTLNVKMDGTLNPLQLNSLKVDLSEAVGTGSVENVRLYEGSEVADEALLATLANGATTLEVADRTLKGRNTFTVVADVKPEAAGEIAAPAVSELMVGGEARTVDSAGMQAVEIGNYILIPADGTSQTFVISDDATFYDAGGADGKIPNNSEGYVTFVPANEGDAIKIDFASFNIFATSSAISVGGQDLFRVYNGRTAAPENLIAEFQTESKTVKSTAADGSLTVYCKSKTPSSYYQGTGWDATVSQFTPSAMTFVGIDGEGSDVTAFAGQSDIPVIYFNLKTENQLNQLVLSDVTLSVPQGLNATEISKASVYYLGGKQTFSTTDFYAEAEVTSRGATISGSQALVEGDNWFAVTFDMKESALTDAVGSMQLASVTVGSTTIDAPEEVEGNVIINNRCEISDGTHSHKLYGEWSFATPAASEYSTKYPSGTTDRIVTFIPTTPGAVAELEFSSFDVTYSTSAYYGVKATFEVYSGATTEAANLLWKLSDAADAKVGPGKKLRSAAADGALTVKFNPNTDTSSYTSEGWEAAVREYVDHDAEVKSVAVTQASTSILAPAIEGAELIDFNVETEGLTNPLTLSGVTLRMKGLSELKRVNIMSMGAKNNPEEAVLWGTAEMTVEGDVVTVTRAADAEPFVLADESNWFRVTVDMNDELVGDIEVDAALTALLFDGGSSYAVEAGDPEGSRLSKNIMLMPEGENTVTIDKPVMLYDDGGPDNNFTKGFSGTLTLVPPAGKIINIDAVEFAVGAADLYVYSGREAISENQIGSTSYYGVNGPSDLYSKADDGSVTIKFVAPSYTSVAGFAIAVTPVDPTYHAVDAVACEAASDEDVVRGSVDVPLLHATVTVAGNYGKVNISEVKADFSSSTDVADIVAASLYYTAKTASFSSATQIAKVSELADGVATFMLEEPITIDESGDYHLWIGADLLATATPDNLASVALVGLTVNETAVEVPADVTAGRHMVSGMGGTYRIGSSEEARYKTIAAAVNSLKFGVEDAVIFEIEDGTYAESITISNVSGSSAEHPVTFTSLSGNRDAVRITGASSTVNPMVLVENSPYIRFNSLTFATESSSYPAIIHYKNSSRYGVVENCVVKAGEASGSSGTSLVRTESGSEANQNCDFFTVKDSYFENGYIALYLGGTSVVANPKDNGLLVSGNTIVNPLSKGIYVVDGENYTVYGNAINADNVTKSSFNGIDLYRPKGVFRVESNKVTLSMSTSSSAASAYGIYLRGVKNAEMGSPDPNTPALVYNNVVSILNSSNYTTYGIYIHNQILNTVVAHNSVRVAGSATVKAGYAMACGAIAAPENSGIIVRNNIFQSISANSPLMIWDDNDYSNITFSGNVWYGGSGNVDNQSTPHSFEEYQTLTGDDISVWAQVPFLSDTDLHLLEAADNLAMPRMEAVLTDADGTERPEMTTAGAYEFSEVSPDAPEIAEGYPVVASVADVSAVVRTKWSVAGQLYSRVQPEADEAPTAEDLRGGRPVSIDADTEVTTNFTLLDQLTAYKAYFMVVSALDVESDVVATETFTTLETIEPLEVAIDFDPDEEYTTGESLLLEAYVTGGKEPYEYTWTDQTGNVIGSDNAVTLELVLSGTYRVTVISADGQEVQAKACVSVLSPTLQIATFDDLLLEPEGEWKYDMALDPSVRSDIFFSGSFRFPNYPWKAYESWCGYGYANYVSTDFADYNDQFKNAVGGGALGTANYGITYIDAWNGNDMSFDLLSSNEEGVVVPGMYITNTAYALNSILNGDGWCEKFSTENGDYFTALIEGLDASGVVTGTVEVPLAEYRVGSADDESNDNPYLLTEWKWVDLSSLGNVHGLRFSYTSSQPDKVPLYFAFDEVGAPNPNQASIGKVGVGVTVSTPASDVLSILGIDGDYTLRIYSPDGVMRAFHELSGEASVSTAGLASGTYIAEIVTEAGNCSVIRFVKK